MNSKVALVILAMLGCAFAFQEMKLQKFELSDEDKMYKIYALNRIHLKNRGGSVIDKLMPNDMFADTWPEV